MSRNIPSLVSSRAIPKDPLAYDWVQKTLASAEATFDPNSILNSASFSSAGYSFDITTAGVVDEIDQMATWVWPMYDVNGNLVFDGTAAWNMLAVLKEVSGTAASDGCVNIGFIDRPDPTHASCNGFGIGLSWSSGGSSNRQPRCWVINSGTVTDNVDSGTNDDSIYCVLEHGRRKLLFREFSASGVQSDGVTASNDLAFITGTNIDMSYSDSPAKPLYAVLGVGSIDAVTDLAFSVKAGVFGQPKPISGYAI